MKFTESAVAEGVGKSTNVIRPIDLFPINADPSSPSAPIIVEDGSSSDPGIEELSDAEINRIHLHLGHASISIILRMGKNAKKKVSSQAVARVLGKCGCEPDLSKVKQHARLSPHRAPWSGHTIGMDTWPPAKNTSNDHPFIIIADRFSRMIVSGPVMDNSCSSALEFLSHRRMAIFGRPSRIITD